MDNKELIRRLINFDDVDGIDTSTGFNSVTSYDDTVRPEDSEDLYRQMVSEFEDDRWEQWQYRTFGYDSERDLYTHTIDHRQTYGKVDAGMIARYIKRCPEVYLKFVPASITLVGDASDIETVFPHIFCSADGGVGIELLDGDTISLGTYIGVPAPRFLSLNYFDKRYDTYRLVGMGVSADCVKRVCISLPRIQNLGDVRKFIISNFYQEGYKFDDWRSDNKIDISQGVEDKIAYAYASAEGIPKFEFRLEKSDVQYLDLSSVRNVDITECYLFGSTVKMFKAREGATGSVTKPNIRRLIKNSNRYIKDIKEIKVEV